VRNPHGNGRKKNSEVNSSNYPSRRKDAKPSPASPRHESSGGKEAPSQRVLLQENSATRKRKEKRSGLDYAEKNNYNVCGTCFSRIRKTNGHQKHRRKKSNSIAMPCDQSITKPNLMYLQSGFVWRAKKELFRKDMRSEQTLLGFAVRAKRSPSAEKRGENSPSGARLRSS